jgi:hypothetical protein
MGRLSQRAARGAVLPALLLYLSTPLAAQQPPVDPTTIPMPNIAFSPTRSDEGDFDKYFFFNRENTDFATAYADLLECHGLASGISLRVDGSPTAGPLVAPLVDAIVGSTLRRELRRNNMLYCMRFKEYRVYGLPKAMWEQFNSQRDFASLEPAERALLLGMQARVASGPRPQVGEVTR